MKQFTASGSTDEVVEADRPTHESPGRVIIVAIKKQESGQPIRITFKEAVAPTRREDSRFRVISKSSSGGRLSQISKNRIDNSRPSEVIVKVVDGKNGSGSATVTHNGGSLSAVPSGSNNNVLRFVYTASAELSTRLSDGSVADRTDAGFASANINTMAGIQLQIPTGWARPNVLDTDGNSAGANVTVTGPRTAFFDFNTAQRGFDEDLVISPSEPYTISVPIRQLLPRQSITLTYGAGTDKAEAQGTKGDVKFLIKSKGGQQGDVFTGLPKGGQLAEIGELQFEVTPAGDGSGTITATVSTGSTGIRNQVYGGDSGIEITFTYTATGQIQPEDTGAFLRIEPPAGAGWTVPQGSPGLPGFTAQAAGNTPRLGAPTFDGVGATFPIPTITKDNTVTIVYGSGAQATAASGAVAPNQKSKALEEAPKFLVTMRGSASGSPKPVIRPGVAANYAFTGIPIEITNAKNGTGTARVSPTETTAGHKRTYVVTYTALGPLFEGAVRLTIPTGWMVKDEGASTSFTAATFNKDTIVITSTGKLVAGDAGFDYTNFANRQVVANIAELQGSQTVTFTLKETTAQPIGSEDGIEVTLDGIEVTFEVESSRTTTTSFASLSGDDNIAKLKVKQAADGSGSMVAFDADGTSVINVVRAGEALSDGIYFKFTPVGTMLNKGRVDLEIPTGWTEPVKEEDNAGGISIVGVGNNGAPSGGAPSGVTGKDPSDRIAFVDLTEDIESANSAFFIKYNNPTAPTVAGVYTFTARSRAQEGGELLALLGSSPQIIVSPAGDGAGAMQIDKTEVAAATAGFVVKFTFTAADTMAGGELTVKIPDSWTPAKDKIKAGDGTTVGKITFKIDTREEPTHSFSLRDGDRTIAIPIASLNLRNQIIFTYEGTAQNVAGTATFETKTKLVNTGRLTPIATQPTLTVKNVAKRTGTVTFNTGDPVDPSRVAAASTGNQITFDFKAVGTMDGGAVSMDVPGNWSPPQDVSGVAGYVTASAPLGGSVGKASVNGQNVTVPITTLGPGQIVRIVYGSGSGSSGAVAQDNAGGATFTFKSKGSGGDNFDDSDDWKSADC